MKKAIYPAAVFLFLICSGLSAESCTLVGSFTQGAKSSDFSWDVSVNRKGKGFSMTGTTSDEYGEAKVSGTCDNNKVCQFAKSYISGTSAGNTFYYAGKANDDGISGKWGFGKGNYNGGNFTAQVIDCK